MIRPSLKGERMAALFLLGVLAFTPPILSIFSVETLLFGIPLLYLYLFVAWAVLIFLMAAAIEQREDLPEGRRAEGDLRVPPPSNDPLES